MIIAVNEFAKKIDSAMYFGKTFRICEGRSSITLQEDEIALAASAAKRRKMGRIKCYFANSALKINSYIDDNFSKSSTTTCSLIL